MLNFIIEANVLRLLCSFLLFATFMTGCGSSTANLSGTVRIDGEILEAGNIKVFDGDGKVHSSSIQSNGSYEFKDIGAGDVTFLVSAVNGAEQVAALQQMASAGSKGASLNRGPSRPPAREHRPNYSRIPRRYMDMTKSDLKTEISAGDNSHDLDLTSE